MFVATGCLDELKARFLRNASVGTVCPWSYGLIPQGWLLCDGQEVPKEDYPELYAFLDQPITGPTFPVPDVPSPAPGIYYIICASPQG